MKTASERLALRNALMAANARGEIKLPPSMDLRLIVLITELIAHLPDQQRSSMHKELLLLAPDANPVLTNYLDSVL